MIDHVEKQYNQLQRNLRDCCETRKGYPLVVLSGGFDSALIVHMLSKLDITFDVMYVDFKGTHVGKRGREHESYVKTLEMYKSSIRNHVVQCLDGIYVHLDNQPRYQQPWAHATAAAINTKPDTSCVLTGILLTDENKTDECFSSVYTGALKCFHPHQWDVLPIPPCITPLKSFTKSEVLTMSDLRLAEHLTFCESLSEEDNCGVCSPCTTFYSALLSQVVPSDQVESLLQQSNRFSGLFNALAKIQKRGDTTLRELGIFKPGTSWAKAHSTYLAVQPSVLPTEETSPPQEI